MGSLHGFEHNACAELSYRDREIHAKPQAYQMEIAASQVKSSHLHPEAKILKETLDKMATAVKDNSKIAERGNQESQRRTCQSQRAIEGEQHQRNTGLGWSK